jgi:DNA-directed RNA polymerase subunit beta'
VNGRSRCGEGKTFSGPEEVRMAYDAGEVHIQARIKCRVEGTMYETTVGRV